MKNTVAIIFLFLPFFSYGQWNPTGDNITSGTIGIGTFIPAPTTPLHIRKSFNGELSFLIENTFSIGTRTSLTSTPTRSMLQTDRDFGLWTNGGGWSEKFTVLNGGNVGIGTASPITKLHVMDNAAGGPANTSLPNQGLLLSGYSTGGSLVLGMDATSPLFYSWIQSRNRTTTETYSLSLNPSGGNVGVGTSTPAAKLHVFGGRGLIENTTEASIQFKASTYSQYWDVGTNNVGYYIYENNSGTYDFVVNKNGNVGIGTTDPKSFKLAVNGKIWATEVQVALNNPGPDYVFEETYNLPSLTDTEIYIKQNKHLPEVPSACEMEEKGINLSEMNMLLLKKVEELTLHLINQQKQIDELKTGLKK